MIRHSGACVLLSALILVLAAFVLYRTEPPLRQEGLSTSVAGANSEPGPVHVAEAGPAPEETPVREEPGSADPADEVRSEPEEIRSPDAPFTLSEEGETLRDVARRIYGSPELAFALRRVNEDLIDRVDSPIKPGSALRTPSLERSP